MPLINKSEKDSIFPFAKFAGGYACFAGLASVVFCPEGACDFADVLLFLGGLGGSDSMMYGMPFSSANCPAYVPARQ